MIGDLLIELTPHIIGVLTVLGVYFLKVVRDFIVSKTTLEDRLLANDIVLAAVMFVEQIAKIDLKLVGQVKFDLAKEKALIALNNKGLSMSEEDLEVMIEAFVFEIKGER